MSRNGPSGHSAARTPQRRPSAEHDPYGAQLPHPQQQPQQSAYWGQQQAYSDPQPAAGYGTPGYGQQAPYGQQQPAYEPGYASYQPSNPYPQAPQRAGSPYGQPQDYGRDLDAQQRAFAPQAPAQPMPFDRFPPAPYPQQPQHGWPMQGQGQLDARGYEPAPYAPQSGGQPHIEPSFQVGPADHFNAPQNEYAEGQDDEGLLEEEEEEPRSGRRMLMIVGALVGAIAVGGALAYTYKSVLGGRPSTLKADAGKARPEVAAAERKSSTRAEESGAPSADADDPNRDPTAPNRVRIIPITPGGQPAPQQAATAPAPSPGIPGIMLDMGPPQRPGPPPGARPPQAPVTASAPPAPVREAAPVRPAAAPVRTVVVNPSADPATPAAPAQPAPKKVAKATVPKASSPDGPSTASLSTPTGAGYVAVLTSQKTRMDALKMFADLQQKYGDVLGTKTPDVQEANLGDKGMWYRAVVGPPGSRDGASNLCGQLKAAGYNGCWVTAY